MKKGKAMEARMVSDTKQGIFFFFFFFVLVLRTFRSEMFGQLSLCCVYSVVVEVVFQGESIGSFVSVHAGGPNDTHTSGTSAYGARWQHSCFQRPVGVFLSSLRMLHDHLF